MSLTRPSTMTLVPASQKFDSSSSCSISMLAVGGRLEHDHVGRRRAAIGFDRRGGAAHVLLDVGLGHAPVGDRGLDDRRGFRRLAERLDRHARHRIDLRDGARPRRRIDRHRLPVRASSTPPPTWPIGVILVFQSVPGSCAVAHVADRPQPHRDVAGAAGAALREIARVGDLGGERRLGGAAEIRVGSFFQPSIVPPEARSVGQTPHCPATVAFRP